VTTEIWPGPGDASAHEQTPLFQQVITKERPVPEHAQEDTGDERIDTGSHNVTGYVKHTQQEIDAVNSTKGFENDLGRWIKQMQTDLPNLDGRWVSIARTHFQQGFMALNRAVFQPESEL
jgi:hypothetical protein